MESNADFITNELEFTANMAFVCLVVILNRQSSSDSVERIGRGIVLWISISRVIDPATID